MWKLLLYKWFGLTPPPCETCEILRERLDESERERKEMLHRLLDKDKPEPPLVQTEELKPVTPQFTPWRVRQQMLESEDRVKAKLMKERAREIADLEKELGIPENKDASKVS